MKLVLTVGLPASGKTFWAKQQVTEHGYKRVNRDDLRAMLDCKKFSNDNERFVTLVQHKIIYEAFGEGYSVIVDDTNLNPKTLKKLKDIAETCGAEVEIKDFTSVPVDVCIARDAGRGDETVGRSVIMRMYNKYLRKNAQYVAYDPSLPECVICDLDGTLALCDGLRSPYDTSKCSADQVCEQVKEILGYCRSMGRTIIFITGSLGIHREERLSWLEKNGIMFDHLYDRWDGDRRPDYEMKKEAYDLHVRNKYNVWLVLDDRQQSVDLWRSLGLKTFQVEYGDF